MKAFIEQKDYDKIFELTKTDVLKGGVALSDLVIKLSEECGELSQAYLKGNALGSDSSRNSSLLEECCDVINVTMAIICYLDDTEVADMFNKKLQKWENKQKERGLK